MECRHQDIEFTFTAGNSENKFILDKHSGTVFVGQGAKPIPDGVGGLGTNVLNFENVQQYNLEVQICDTMRVGGVNVQAAAFQWSRDRTNGGPYTHNPLCSRSWMKINILDTNDFPVVDVLSMRPRFVWEN